MRILLLSIIITGLSLLTPAKNFAQPKTALVVNGLAETLSRINLENDSVFNHVTTLGVVPNQVVIRGSYAYVVNSTSSNIQILNWVTNSQAGVIALGPGRNPWNMAFLDTTTAFVTNFATGTLTRVNLISKAVESEVPIGLSPEGVLVTNGLVYVCNTGFDPNDFSFKQGTVAIFDPFQGLQGILPVGTNPQALARDPWGKINVVCTGNYNDIAGAIYFVDPETNQLIDSLLIGGQPGGIAIAPNGIAYLSAGGYVGSGLVYSYDTQTRTVLHGPQNPIPVGTGASAVATDNLNQAYVCSFSSATVTKIDSSGTPAGIYLVGDGPLSIAIYDASFAGDLSRDRVVDLTDIVMLINYVFFGSQSYFVKRLADVNADCIVDLSDIMILIGFVFFGAPDLRGGCE